MSPLGSASKRSWSRVAFALLIAVGPLGCARARDLGSEAAFRLNPFGSDPVFVDHVQPLGPYLYVSLRSRRTQLDLLAPPTEACAHVLAAEATVRYAKHGTFGRLHRDERFCDPSGVASLAAWRDRRPRPRGSGPLPRAPARFTVVYRDDEAVLARGRFPLAGRVQIPGGFDLVALLPNTPQCQKPLELGEATMTFRAAGRDPFRLMVPDGDCVILGFAMPVEDGAKPDPPR